MFFGKKMKELRLKYAKAGIRRFKDKMNTTLKVSELFNIEHGYAPLPDCSKFMAQLNHALDINIDSKDWKELVRLALEPFIMQTKSKVIISPLNYKSDGSPFTIIERVDLNDYLNCLVEEHNKKAEEYNKKHNGL